MKTMIVTFQVPQFNEKMITKVYLACTNEEGAFKRYDVNRVGYTLRESFVDGRDYPQDIVRAVVMLKGCMFNQVLVEERK